MKRYGFFACYLVIVAACPHVVAEQLAEDVGRIRGANYTPSYASTSVATWVAFQPDVIDRELAFAKRLKLNSVRVYLQFTAYEKDPQQFLERLESFLQIAERHELRPMFVLFDSCFGKEPSLEEIDSEMWVNNPGYRRIAAADWTALDAYVKDVVSAHADDSRVLMWDIMNEPMADFEHVQPDERARIWQFCRHMCRLVKNKDARHPITVGHAVVEYIPKTADLVDVFSIHSYARYPDWLQDDYDLAKQYSHQYGKPLVITEFGNPGAGQSYEMALDVIERNQLGYYFWELMIAKVMFKEMAGLVYPDGTVRDLSPIARLLDEEFDPETDSPEVVAGFRRKIEGGIPQKQPPDGRHLRDFLGDPEQWRTLLDRAKAAPRTRQNITAAVAPLAMLGRRLHRPNSEAQQVFELALNIPHHFRLGRDAEAIADFETLLSLVSDAAEPILKTKRD